MKRILLIVLIVLCKGFLSAWLNSLNVDIEYIYTIHFMAGWICCFITFYDS